MINYRLGDILVEEQKITRNQVKDAILYKLEQRKIKNRKLLIGEAFIELGFIKAPELMRIMEEMGIKLRVGEILIKNEYTTYEKIREIIDKGIEEQLLEVLVKRYIITQDIMNDTLSEQLSKTMTAETFLELFLKIYGKIKYCGGGIMHTGGYNNKGL